MSTQGETLYHPVNGSEEQTWEGFSWPAFFFGVLWLLVKGLYGHFLINLVIVIATSGLAAPIVWVVYGFIGNGVHKNSLIKKGYLTNSQWEKVKIKVEAEIPTEPKPMGFQKDIIEKLKDLDELRNRGILTNEEFASQKSKLLNT